MVIPFISSGCGRLLGPPCAVERHRARREAMERARAHAESGNLSAATECYQRAVNIAPWMAKVVMEVGEWLSRGGGIFMGLMAGWVSDRVGGDGGAESGLVRG